MQIQFGVLVRCRGDLRWRRDPIWDKNYFFVVCDY